MKFFNLCASIRVINKCLNVILVIVFAIFFIILYSLYTCPLFQTLYVPFALSVSIIIAILTVKANIRQNTIDYHAKMTEKISTELHIQVSNINILLQIITYLKLLYEGKTITNKYHLLHLKTIINNIIEKLYSKNVVFF